jgi:hypothetical protein
MAGHDDQLTGCQEPRRERENWEKRSTITHGSAAESAVALQKNVNKKIRTPKRAAGEPHRRTARSPKTSRKPLITGEGHPPARRAGRVAPAAQPAISGGERRAAKPTDRTRPDRIGPRNVRGKGKRWEGVTV